MSHRSEFDFGNHSIRGCRWPGSPIPPALVPRVTLAVLTACLVFAMPGSAAPVVTGVDRFYRDSPGRLAEAGEILLTELGCVHCHEMDDALSDRIPLTPGPGLDGVGDRLRTGYLTAWLSAPHETRSGTRMPDLLATKSAPERAAIAGALVQFLQTLSGPTRAEGRSAPGDPEAGRDLFHSIGCVACHAPRSDFIGALDGPHPGPGSVPSFSTPLAPPAALAGKYRREGLIDFLVKADGRRSAGHMPGFDLNRREAADLADYLAPGANGTVESNRIERRSLVRKGLESFFSLGCASCHSVNADVDPGAISASRVYTPLAGLSAIDTGCLSRDPMDGVPFYHLDDFQREAITAALAGLTEVAAREPLTAAAKARRAMIRLNCHACHERDGIGGPDASRRPYFVSHAADLGDEGRLPPTLTGVGRKLRVDALERIIRGEFPARPYMATRMPDFGPAHAKRFAEWFSAADRDPDELPTPRDGAENQVGRNMWGRALVGTRGLSCITCHALNGNRSLGIQSMDLALAPERLRAEWFRDYLIDPAKFRPGTRMPSFWPDGKPSVKGHGGSTARQIDSIWAYLNEVDQSRLPEGLDNKADLLLRPGARPIVFRTFMEHAGTHAVAVGFEAGVHAAFDSRDPRWVMAWTGPFLNAEATWEGRFTPPTRPAGDFVIPLQPLAPFTDSPMAFRGYILDPDSGIPEFRYRIGKTVVGDTLRPSDQDDFRIVRSLRSAGNGDPVWVEIASGNAVDQSGTEWQVDGRLDVSTTATTRTRTNEFGVHLQVRIPGAKSADAASASDSGPAVSVRYDW